MSDETPRVLFAPSISVDREYTYRYGFMLVGAFFVFVVGVLAADAGRSGRIGVMTVFAGAGVAWAVFVIQRSRVRVVAETSCLVIVNMWHTVRIPWSDITEVRARLDGYGTRRIGIVCSIPTYVDASRWVRQERLAEGIDRIRAEVARRQASAEHSSCE